MQGELNGEPATNDVVFQFGTNSLPIPKYFPNFLIYNITHGTVTKAGYHVSGNNFYLLLPKGAKYNVCVSYLY